MTHLARRLGLFDAVMIVMGGIIGSGIFINPYLVARQLPAPAWILGAWAVGGTVALAGAFIWAELAARKPELGGQYAYLREAYHPIIAFIYGWTLLLVIQTGGMAAVAITFARYFRSIASLPVGDTAVAVLALALLTAINCLGVREGSLTQNIFMTLKIAAISGIVACGFLHKAAVVSHPAMAEGGNLLRALGAALTPIAFSYGGWQTASFMSGELRNVKRDLTRGLVIGVLGVIALYVAVNFAYLHVLGAAGLGNTTTPASTMMQQVLGDRGASLTAVAISLSTFGFLSQGMLTAPRVYFAMAADGLFFRGLTWVPERTQAPVAAIALQGLLAIVIAISGRYEQILSYVTSSDFLFFGLTAGALFVFRRRQPTALSHPVPGHPWTTAMFVCACALIVLGTVVNYPLESLTGWGILASGVPAYIFWSRKRA